PALSAVWGAPCAWSSDTKLLCSAVLNTTAAPKPAPGPRIHELKSGAAPARTYSDLLQGGADDELFEHYAGVRLIQIEVSGEEPSTKDLPLQGLISAASVSPDGRYVLVNRLRRPYSRLLPVNKFPVEQAIVDCESGATVHSVLDLTDTTNTGVTLGPRLGVWNPNKQAEVAYVERAMVSPAAARDSLF